MTISDVLAGRADGPAIERVRHEPRRRLVRVERIERVTPGMLRITFGGDDLAGFRSLGFDDHLKLFVPGSDERRDYTPRAFDPAAGTLVLDFALHEGGPATVWALAAESGDTVEIGSPKGSAMVSSDVRRWLLIGDETALPAIGRCIEEAGPGVRITSVVAVAGPGERQAFATRADLKSLWAFRPLADAANPSVLLDLVGTVGLEPETFVWIAAEATVARAVRDLVVEERGHPRGWTKAGGYWIAGRPAGKERIG